MKYNSKLRQDIKHCLAGMVYSEAFPVVLSYSH